MGDPTDPFLLLRDFVTFVPFGAGCPPLVKRRYSLPGILHLPVSGSFSHSILPALHQFSRIVNGDLFNASANSFGEYHSFKLAAEARRFTSFNMSLPLVGKPYLCVLTVPHLRPELIFRMSSASKSRSACISLIREINSNIESLIAAYLIITVQVFKYRATRT